MLRIRFHTVLLALLALHLAQGSELFILPSQATEAIEHYHQGLTHQQAGKNAAAETAYLQALTQDPELYPARYNLALIYLQSQRLAEAQFQTAQALKQWQVDADLHALAGLIAETQGQTETAQAAWHRACQLNAAHAVCQQQRTAPTALMPRPEALQALQRGEAHQQAGQGKAALAQLRHAASLEPDWASPAYVLGQVLAQQAQPEAARLAWKEALRRDPGHIGALEQLALQAEAQNQLQQAQSYWETALAQRPRFSQAYAALARLKESQGKYVSATRWREQLQQLSPDWPGNRYQLARLYFWQGKLTQARGLLQQQTLLPRPELLLLSEVLLAQGEANAAQLLLEQGPHSSQDAELQSALAACHLAQNQIPQARHYLSLALGHTQVPAEAYALRGQLALQEQEPHRALHWIEAAVQQAPSSRYYELLIFAQLKSGQPGQALKTLKTAHLRYPEHPAFRQQVQLLQNQRFLRKGRY